MNKISCDTADQSDSIYDIFLERKIMKAPGLVSKFQLASWLMH